MKILIATWTQNWKTSILNSLFDMTGETGFAENMLAVIKSHNISLI